MPLQDSFMTDSIVSSTSIEVFIARWKASGASERANYVSYLNEMCDQLNVPRPDPARQHDELNAYVFERAVTFQNGDGTTNTGRIDLYKRDCFVLEAKQGSDRKTLNAPLFDDANFATEAQQPRGSGRGRKGTAVRGTRGWDVAMREARGQAEQYVRALPAAEGNPPFLIVVDVGYSIELYSDFTRAGKTYVPFPDARNHRILIDDLKNEETRDRLRLIWTDPLALDPGRRSARVTREVARSLALLARSLEESGHAAERVANFLMRAIFTMFAEDVRLIPAGGFTNALEDVKQSGVEIFAEMIGSLWETMNAGGFSPIMKQRIIRFNGGLFESCEALPLTLAQLELLIEAARADWRDVEPAIFGTLLERALDPRERHKLGAHYTPRAYVERLVMPAIIEPLREEWDAVMAGGVTLANNGKLAEAAEETRAFHRRLCRTRVLDPACGSGNFLYVTLEHMKRLEGEVLDALHGFGDSQGILEDAGMTVDPHQLLGLEVNPRAAAIADLVLWIGYLQWHFRTRGEALPPEPVLKKFHNIERRDAVLAYDAIEPEEDERGQTKTRWDGRTTKKHTVTGEDVPDETARVNVDKYVNPRKAMWPEADYIIGNPPFIGARRIRATLGHEYVGALRSAYPEIPETSDYVMYWWHKAAEAVESGKCVRFGLITTNSIGQSFSRGVIEQHLSAKNGVSIIEVIPDHPWVDETDGASVRVAITVVEQGNHEGVLKTVIAERRTSEDNAEIQFAAKRGKINADLTVGVDVVGASVLQANENLACVGYQLSGTGFTITHEQAAQLGLGRIAALDQHIKPLRSGRDLTQTTRDLMAIDLWGMNINEVRAQFPEVYQWILDRVKPERDQNNRASVRERWWIFGEARSTFRPALFGLKRFIVTSLTAKHRFFVFYPADFIADSTTVLFALDDAFNLGVLSSRIHVAWSLAAGGRLGVGNDPRYSKSRGFDTFPFPDCTDEQKACIRESAEALDAHRKRQQAQHPTLTITDMYNVLQKLRANVALNEREQLTHTQGLISVLKQIHDDLDAATCAAYGYPANISDEEILERLVELNAARAAEEHTGQIRWLRPAYQKPTGGVATAFEPDTDTAAAIVTKKGKQEWPKTIPEQARAVRHALHAERTGATAAQLAKQFTRARVERIEELLQTLASLGQARETERGRFVA